MSPDEDLAARIQRYQAQIDRYAVAAQMYAAQVRGVVFLEAKVISISKGMFARMKLFGYSQWAMEAILAGAGIRIYGGTVPVDADAALPLDAVLLGAVYPRGGGDWAGSIRFTGNASFFRWEDDTDRGEAGSDTHDVVRVQGGIGQHGGDLNLASTALWAGATINITNFRIEPTSV